MTQEVMVLPVVRRGIIEPSAICRFSIPKILRLAPTTDMASLEWSARSDQDSAEHEGPIPLASKFGVALTGLYNAGHIVAAAGFQQEHADIRIFSQLARYHRTGGAKSADDEVVVWP
jgi:hypothetical protein